jgi:hypothetical protein
MARLLLYGNDRFPPISDIATWAKRFLKRCLFMSMTKRKLRTVETAADRDRRHELEARLKKVAAASEEDAVDAMIRKNIKLYGA